MTENTGTTLRSISADILVIEEVAELLRCSVDTLRRIPKQDLPVYAGPGRKQLYLREDIIRYLKGRRIIRPDVDRLVAEIEQSVLMSTPDSARERSQRRAS